MKRFLLVGVAILPLLIQPYKARAVIFACANCSSIAEQLVSDAKQVQQYATQISQYQTQLQQYQNMLQNTVTLPQAIWSTVTNDIMQVRNLTNAASLLTGNSGTIMSRLQSAQGYASQATFLPQNMGSQFTMWQQTLGNASNSLGRTLGVQQGQEQNDAALQARIQLQSQSAVGQMQAIQAGNQLAGLANTQLNEIQTTLTAYAQDAATHEMVSDDELAAQNAALLRMTTDQNVPLTGYKGY